MLYLSDSFYRDDTQWNVTAYDMNVMLQYEKIRSYNGTAQDDSIILFMFLHEILYNNSFNSRQFFGERLLIIVPIVHEYNIDNTEVHNA